MEFVVVSSLVLHYYLCCDCEEGGPWCDGLVAAHACFRQGDHREEKRKRLFFIREELVISTTSTVRLV